MRFVGQAGPMSGEWATVVNRTPCTFAKKKCPNPYKGNGRIYLAGGVHVVHVANERALVVSGVYNAHSLFPVNNRLPRGYNILRRQSACATLAWSN